MSVVTKIYAKQQNEVIFFDLIIFCSRYSDAALRNIKNAFYIIHLIVPYYFAIINSAEAFGSKLFLKKPKLCSLFLISVPSSIRLYHQSPLI